MTHIKTFPRDLVDEKTRRRFWEKVRVDDSGCWLWIGNRNQSGYGAFFAHRDVFAAHRAAYEILVGPIPRGLTLDHLCRNKACVNPDHLEPVTQAENKRRDYDARPLCRNGIHLKTPDTVYVDGRGKRCCRPCMAEKQRRYLKRKSTQVEKAA